MVDEKTDYVCKASGRVDFISDNSALELELVFSNHVGEGIILNILDKKNNKNIIHKKVLLLNAEVHFEAKRILGDARVF